MSAPSGYKKIAIVGYGEAGGYMDNKRYYRNQVVHYYGYSYICIQDSSKGHDPTDAMYWKPMIVPEEEED